MSSTITDYLKTGNAPQRRGNLANSRSPGAGSFPCRTGVISLGVNEEAHFQSLARSLGCGHWLDDPRFSKPDARKKHAADLVAEIEEKLLEKDAVEWEAILQKNGVPAARLRSLPEALASDQVGRADLCKQPMTVFRCQQCRFVWARGPLCTVVKCTKAG